MKHTPKEPVKPEVTLIGGDGSAYIAQISDIAIIKRPLVGRSAVYLHNGGMVYADHLGGVFHKFAGDKNIRAILENIPVEHSYTYRDENGQNAETIDRRSAESYIPGPRPL